MGILSWFKKKKSTVDVIDGSIDIVTTATEPIDVNTAQKLREAASQLRGSSGLIPPPMPGVKSNGAHVMADGAPRSTLSAPMPLAPMMAASDPNALGSVRRYFVHMAAAKMVRYDRNQAQDWQAISVERFFMSITGTRPTINQSGIQCSDTIGTIDDAFASFQWD
jgi:hypothetical protein